MTTIKSHTVISKDNQSCLVVHFLDHLLNELLGLEQLSLDLGVHASIRVTCAVHTDRVKQHEVEFAASVQLIKHVLPDVAIKVVEVSEVGWPRLSFCEPVTEARQPNIFSVENSTCLIAKFVL